MRRSFAAAHITFSLYVSVLGGYSRFFDTVAATVIADMFVLELANEAVALAADCVAIGPQRL